MKKKNSKNAVKIDVENNSTSEQNIDKELDKKLKEVNDKFTKMIEKIEEIIFKHGIKTNTLLVTENPITGTPFVWFNGKIDEMAKISARTTAAFKKMLIEEIEKLSNST